MGEKASFPYALTASAGAEGFVTIATIPAGRTFRAKRIHVHFPVDAAGMLDVALYYGDLKVHPTEGLLTGDDTRFTDEVDVRYYSLDPIRIYYRNRDTATEKTCYLKLEGELE